ncbi:hypothetical protein BV898_12984 [Hypsibius exemplaris]|uniref:G-protein coupled receptors family 1 profile domain-containing protein n=1 Tax=Hypsibius exemplaris TaxID=2072580 RepID=A0A1W0WC20_HYPEX|nr:hypothetical protein BV898_12984 [Hypsibius exemplaris]
MRNATSNLSLSSDLTSDPLITENAKLNRILFIPVLSIVIYVLGLLFNGTFLLVFAKNPTLRTPFNVYIINLFLGNLGIILFQFPLTVYHIATGLPGRPKWLYNNHICSLFLWANQVMPACVTACHELIAITRIWAVLFPVHFRSHHSARLAIGLSVALWVVVSGFCLIGLAVDAVLFRKLVVPYVCVFNVKAMPIFWGVAQFLCFVLPEVVVVGSLPIIGVARLSRWQKRRRRIAHGSSSGPTVSVVPRSVSQQSQSALPVLVALTVSVVACWTPNLVYTAMTVMRPAVRPTGAFWKAELIMFTIQIILDPILFLMALRTLRDGVRSLLSSISSASPYFNADGRMDC